MTSRTLAIAAALSLAACTQPQVSGTLLVSYDAGVAAETAYLATGKATPAMATKLRKDRVQASQAIQAVVAAEAAGGNTAALVTAAQAALSIYVADTTQGAK